jgi:subtilisin family serine protease
MSSAEDGYYYSDGRQIELSVNPDKIVIAFAGGQFGTFDQFLLQYPELSPTARPERIGRNVFAFQLQGETNIDSLVSVIRDDSVVAQASGVFVNELGGEEFIGQYIVLKKSYSLSEATFDSLLVHFNAAETGGSQYLTNVTFLRVDKSNYSVLQTANRLYEHEDIIWCHPVFLKRDYQLFYEPQDKLFPWQYNYHNGNIYDAWWTPFGVQGKDIGVKKAWEITLGNPEIKVAVLDEGITDHPDFPAGALIDSIDIVGASKYDPHLDSNCVPCDSCGHGFSASGLVIADHNDSGIAGLVPDCKLIFIKIVDDTNRFANEDKLAEAIVMAAREGANVISGSWGCFFCTPTDVMIEALNTVTDPVIEGHSCAVFFSSGNWGWFTMLVAYPARMPQVMAVGSTDSVDCWWYYSSGDTTLDIVATSADVRRPDLHLMGSIMTTDRPGPLGYNVWMYDSSIYYPICNWQLDPEVSFIGVDYFCSFGGTSAACPQAAGIAAMVMSRRPDLADSNFLIYDILKFSAEDQIGHPYCSSVDPPGYDTQYGWGRINAFRALLSVSRGDANNSGTINILDATYLISFLYKGGPAPTPDYLMGDANCSGVVSILDVTYIQAYLYGGAPMPPICFNYGN